MIKNGIRLYESDIDNEDTVELFEIPELRKNVINPKSIFLRNETHNGYNIEDMIETFMKYINTTNYYEFRQQMFFMAIADNLFPYISNLTNMIHNKFITMITGSIALRYYLNKVYTSDIDIKIFPRDMTEPYDYDSMKLVIENVFSPLIYTLEYQNGLHDIMNTFINFVIVQVYNILIHDGKPNTGKKMELLHYLTEFRNEFYKNSYNPLGQFNNPFEVKLSRPPEAERMNKQLFKLRIIYKEYDMRTGNYNKLSIPIMDIVLYQNNDEDYKLLINEMKKQPMYKKLITEYYKVNKYGYVNYPETNPLLVALDPEQLIIPYKEIKYVTENMILKRFYIPHIMFLISEKKTLYDDIESKTFMLNEDDYKIPYLKKKFKKTLDLWKQSTIDAPVVEKQGKGYLKKTKKRTIKKFISLPHIFIGGKSKKKYSRKYSKVR